MPGCAISLASSAAHIHYTGRMNEHDQRRLGQLISKFLDLCGSEPRCYLFEVGSNGSVIVSRHTNSAARQVCASSGALAR